MDADRAERWMGVALLTLWLVAYCWYAFHDVSSVRNGLIAEHVTVLIGMPLLLFFAKKVAPRLS